MTALTINGQRIEVPPGTSVLESAQALGIKIPTLCYHKALSPYGACRLCLVEVEQEGRPPSLQASCSYPALEGLVVRTDTPRVHRTRKIVAELLLARCPESPEIQKLASDFGVKEPRIQKRNDDCIYCGLCVRMCHERMGRAAITFSGRGPRRKVEPPYGLHNEMCWTCGACAFLCPTKRVDLSTVSVNPAIPIPDQHNLGLSPRSAIHIPYPQAIPNKPVIDERACVHLLYGKCEVCREICGAQAIDYEQKDEFCELKVGAVVLSPGYETFDAKLKPALGYGRFRNVVTALEFERILSASGPFQGQILRPSDHKTPKRIAFIQCVGSREPDRDYCSAVCCMYATKEALIAKEHIGEDLECDIFYMDLRAFGKGFEAYYERAKAQGVNYIRSRPPVIEEAPETGNLVIKYLTEGDRKASREYDLVVLATGMVPPRASQQLAETFGIELNGFNFCRTSAFEPARSSREGVYVAGPFAEPKDIPETVMHASAAAAEVLALLRDARGSLIATREYPPEIDVRGQEPRIGVFVCHCGTNIAGVVDVLSVAEYARTLQDVVYAEDNLYTCSNDTQERIKQKIREHNLNRVVVASCSPRTHEPLFRNTCREAGLNPYLFEMANIRDQCSWVHMHEHVKATQKAQDLVRMAVAKARLLEPLQKGRLPLKKAALVIGGGLAGMVAAAKLSSQGVEVYLVEREKELGGNLRRIRYLMNGADPQEHLKVLMDRVRRDERIHLFTEARITAVEGSIGNFKTTVSVDHHVQTVEHGVTVVATGATEYVPREYLCGQCPDVITQLELEARLSGDGRDGISGTVVMIQCVGSRDKERPYCSRVCCAEAIKNALRLKQKNPGVNVYVLYRDVRTYGFQEAYYSQAREQGVIFLRYEEGRKPEVTRNGRGLEVTVYSPLLDREIVIPADLLVLSAGTVADPGNKEIAQFLKVPLNQDGFFLEAHMKLRPVDFATDGVFVCGLAHSAKSVEESILQAEAAAARASAILSRDYVELEAAVSCVVEEKCDGCAYCVDPCPFKAIRLIEYQSNGTTKKRVQVDEAVCKGCGTCQATCPKDAIFVRHFRPEQLLAQVHAALNV